MFCTTFPCRLEISAKNIGKQCSKKLSVQQSFIHGIIHYIDTKAKCRRLKKLTRKETLRQVFIRDSRLEIQSVIGIFDPVLWTGAPVPSLWFNFPPPPPPCVEYAVCKGEGYGGALGLRQINTCRKVFLQLIFLDDDILHCLLWVLSFYGFISRIGIHAAANILQTLSPICIKYLGKIQCFSVQYFFYAQGEKVYARTYIYCLSFYLLMLPLHQIQIELLLYFHICWHMTFKIIC
jgi:hypothetical protein